MLSEIGRVEIWKCIEFKILKVFGFINANTDLVIILGFTNFIKNRIFTVLVKESIELKLSEDFYFLKQYEICFLLDK